MAPSAGSTAQRNGALGNGELAGGAGKLGILTSLELNALQGDGRHHAIGRQIQEVK